MNTKDKLRNKISLVCLIISMIFLSGAITGCKKNVTVDPPVTSLVRQTVFENNRTAASAVTAIYDQMINGLFTTGPNSISFLMGEAADELKTYSSAANYQQFYKNALIPNPYFWKELYQYIYDANAVLEGLNSSTNLSSSTVQQLTGEAKFIRAFLLFYTANLYGDIPMPLTTNYVTNNTISRTPVAQVFQQIVSDLKDAQGLLSDNYVDLAGTTTTERIRPNKSAATALLARAYLYESKYDSAEIQATAVINNTSKYSLLSNLNSVFLKNSLEAIWQLQPGNPTFLNGQDGFYFILTAAPGSAKPVAISSFLFSAFEAGDGRFINWIGKKVVGTTTYYYPFKYTVGTSNQPQIQYLMVLRLAEQYLIRAEARAKQNNINGAISDLNVIRNRAFAGTGNYAGATDQTSVLAAILHERQVELFTEWGHRWFDLKRTEQINFVMGSPGAVCAAKGGSWSANWQLLPIPSSEINNNPNLTQNPGY